MASRSLLVVGAGIVGLACAVEAQRRGKQVTLIDCTEPGHGCSLGNAGILAVSEIFPLITPARLLALPQMLLSRDAPAVVRTASMPKLLPWMLRAARSFSAERQRGIVTALSALNRNAVSSWRSLLDHCDASHLLREKGMIRLIRDEQKRAGLQNIREALQAHSLPTQMLNRDELREMEPAIGKSVAGGLLHLSDADIGDPLITCRALADAFVARGGTILRQTAIALRPTEIGADLQTETGTHQADQVLVTAGIRSADLLVPLGVTVPLQAERGYHLMLTGFGQLLGRPVTFQQESCVATPMGADLRLAGTVEFAHPDADPDWSRAEQLVSHAARYFDQDLAFSAAQKWIGNRPSLPDSLPAIGRLSQAKSSSASPIGYAFGHQHLGITQAAISAVLLNQLMDDQEPEIDCRAFSVERFTQFSLA